MFFLRSVIMIAISCLVFGCAVPPPIQTVEQLDSQNCSVVFIAPKTVNEDNNNNQTVNDLLKKFKFSSIHYIERNNSSLPDYHTLYAKLDNGKFTVKNSKGYYSRKKGSYNPWTSLTYSGSIETTENKDSYKFTFLPEKKDFYAKMNPITGKPSINYNVDLSIEKLSELLKETKIYWELEVDSPYNTDSTYSNFTRLTRKEVFRGEGQKDPMTGKIFKERFWVKIGNEEIAIKVETYPYRNGSKAVVYAILPGEVSGNIVDFSKAAEQLKKEIARIVNS